MTVRAAIELVAQRFDVAVDTLIRQDRRPCSVRPRQIAYWLARHTAGVSLPRIAMAFGGRDHTTILSGFRAAERLIEQDADLRAWLETAIDQLGGRRPFISRPPMQGQHRRPADALPWGALRSLRPDQRRLYWKLCNCGIAPAVAIIEARRDPPYHPARGQAAPVIHRAAAEEASWPSA